MRSLKISFWAALFSCAGFSALPAQVLFKNGWQLGQHADPASGLRSNSISDIVIEARGDIWLGTGKGLSRSRDGGKTWVTYTSANGLPRGGISAIAVTDSIIWVAAAFDSLTKDAGRLPTGAGLSYSTNDGQNWTHVLQFGPTPVQNVTYDIAVRNNQVWATNFGGGLQLSTDRGKTWTVVPPDTFLFDPLGNLNHRAFSILNADGVLWHGTAGGINKSLDGGKTWTNFSHQNQAKAISGNFVVAIGQQKWRGREYIWAATVNAEDPKETRAVSLTEDGGYSWRVTLAGEFAHNFAFDDSVAYVVTDNGLFKSIDFGRTWAKYTPVIDNAKGEQFLTTEYYAVGAYRGRVWTGGPDGVATTDNDGRTWSIQRGSQKAGENGEPRTYAYPNPFSPFRHNQFRADGHVRFQYNTTRPTKATIKVFDFAMELVAEVANQIDRPMAGQYAEVWNGRNTRGDIVANGVYFYRLDLEGEGTFWGKILVLD
jgi:ligand-binding sensor domain-containing protein